MTDRYRTAEQTVQTVVIQQKENRRMENRKTRNGKQIRRMIASVVLSGALAVPFCPLTAYAAPESAYSAETWEKLRDNKMEYDEISLLVQEYNPYYLNNAASYADSKTTENANEIRQGKMEDAEDLESSADQMADNADSLMDQLEELVESGATGASGLASSYASLKASSALLHQNSITTRQSANISYEDADTKALNQRKKQTALIVQAQGLFASYNLARISVPVIENSIAMAERNVARVQNKIAAGTATQSALLSAQNSLKSLQGTLTSTKASVESVRQSLLLNTGWASTDSPEICGVPEPDLSRIETMNPEADVQTALDENISLKLDRKTLTNMDSGTTDYQNQVRTIASEEQTIRNSVKSLYQTILTDRAALETAQSAVDVQQKKLSSMQTSFGAGLCTKNELLDQEASAASAEVDLITAKINLQQAIQTYEWALQGYMTS